MASDTIMFLPDEVIEYILEDPQVTFADVVSFSLTCKHLYSLISCSNKLWKTKFFRRWPFVKEVYKENEPEKEIQISNWKEVVRVNTICSQQMLYQLSSMSGKHYTKQELSDSMLKEFGPLFRTEAGAHPLAYYVLVDELINLVKRPAPTSNLTNRYYAFKVLQYLKQSFLKNEWQKFQNLPPKRQTLERGATIVAQWCQPDRHVLYSHISELLDNIAEQTKELLREQCPGHSIFKVTEEQLAIWNDNIIDDNQWSIVETRQVMETLCNVLFHKLGFHGNGEMYYTSENLFIDRVLERRRGVPITLSIVFESVARRLGIRCEPVSFPSHFLLRWKESYNPEASGDDFYIDVFNGGQFLTKRNCPRVGGISKCPIERYNVHEPASAIEVVMRMANNLEVAGRQHTHLNGRVARIRCALELRHMIQPHCISTILQLGRFYMLHQIDLTEPIKMLEDLQRNKEATSRQQAILISTLQTFCKHLQPEIEVHPKVRTANVKYAVGLIMKHKTNGYLCVITGWDPCCEAPREWMNEMSVDQLENGADQPFYNVFVGDGSSRYSAQENLQLAPSPRWIKHYEIGRYFRKFEGTHYVPNDEKAKEYPEDEGIRNKLIRYYEHAGMQCESRES